MLTSTSAGMNTGTGPSTVAIRGHNNTGTNHNNNNIPQALLMTNVPVPSLDRSATPPPNPAYWPMPEYTYTGTGSHEYDVPRLFDSMGQTNRAGMLSRSTVPDSTSPMMNQPFVSLNGTSLGMPLSPCLNPHLSLTEHRMHPNSSICPGNSVIPTQWSQTAKPGIIALMNPLLNWTSNLVNGATMSVRPDDRPILVNGHYAQYPSNHSASIYSTDYPTYLQTRPYPHHHHHPHQQSQFRPLIELTTAVASRTAASANSPGNLHASPVTKISSSSGLVDVDPWSPDTFLNRAPIQQHSAAHTVETNLSVNGSDPC
ncbi:unnamed protein product [Echinostoma caproni]|uniref:RunxI domain-containing protein n=1 Tax=Echinostoma caproni TaxID=27848 RepID=A0A183AYL5_9TREM|nr:unnamed protein product [Echinostoma caproni]